MIFMMISVVLGGFAFALLSYEWLQKRAKVRTQQEKKHRLGLPAKKKKEANKANALLNKTPLKVFVSRGEQQRIQASYERDLPACLEVVALGMQAGMSFDQAFALYTERFDTLLAAHCGASLSVWQKGLKSRDEGLRELAEKIGTASFKHFSSSVLRALRFGSPMTPLLLALAAEARKEYRAQRQELVAKAPIKMLLPTGVLILPAMLLLVMGPILLDLLRNMG